MLPIPPGPRSFLMTTDRVGMGGRLLGGTVWLKTVLFCLLAEPSWLGAGEGAMGTEREELVDWFIEAGEEDAAGASREPLTA